MSKQAPSAICIQALAPLSEQDFSDVFGHLNEKGMTCTFEQRQSTAYASLDWLIPTGIVLFITRSYFDGIFKEAGKEHYHWFKTALSSLYKKALGDSPEVEFTVVSAGKPKTPSHFSGTLSFFYANDHGYRVKLLFPLDVTADDYALSCEEFMKLITAHEERLTNDSLGKEIEFQAQTKAALTGNAVSIEHIRPTVTLLVFWSRHDSCFHVTDPVASSRSGKLISKAISRA
ncbi:MAG: hypothetical protein ABIR13_09115 [Polaromonas sp.]